jgi:aromatic-L-amino-acid/L-tryptophan decarboxylase
LLTRIAVANDWWSVRLEMKLETGAEDQGSGKPTTCNTLELSTAEMRALGHQVIEILVDHFASQHEAIVGRKGSPEKLGELVGGPLPLEPSPPGEIVERLREQLFENMLHVDHPRFFAFVPSPSNFVSVMADTLAAGLNAFAGTYLAGSGAAQVELVTIDWLRQICGLPETAGGLFVSGGSMANLTGLVVARHVKLGDDLKGAVAYLSDQSHSSVARAFRVLGIPDDRIRRIGVDSGFRLQMAELRSKVANDRSAGLRPFCVVGNAGTTNTGAVDPLRELSTFCNEEGLWLHVDGAYGAPAILVEEQRPLLEGMELADSVSLDPHKWLFQPFEAGCLLVRDRSQLLATFQVMPEYLRDTHGVSEEVNFGNYGVQLTRSFRALKLWLSLKTFGLHTFRDAVARGIELAEIAERELRKSGEWEIVTRPSLAVVTFRYVDRQLPTGTIDRLHGRLVEAMLADGYAFATSTVLDGRPVLRFCTINPRTTDEEIKETVRRMTQLARGLALA